MATAAQRAALRQPISRRRELALQLAVLAGLASIAAVLLMVGTYLHRGDARLGRREAELQLERMLLANEQVVARTPVSQRHWYDHFRATPGVLAATDRRLLYVGTVPPTLFRPRNDDPPAFVERAFTWDTTLRAEEGRVLAGTQRGVIVRSGGITEEFALRPADREQGDALVRLIEQRRATELAELRRQRFIFDSIAALPPPPPQRHRVRPGESLFGIARQYNVTPEVLRAMNNLTSDRIRINDELVVRRFRRVNGLVVEYYGPPE